MRQLVARNKNSIKAYLKYVTKECRQHHMQRKLDKVNKDLQVGPALPTHYELMERIDTQKSDIQRRGEGRPRKIIKPILPFSPQVRGINMRQQAYVNMVAWHVEDKLSGGKVFCAAA